MPVISLILLHGFPHNHHLWTPQLGGLANHADCFAPDVRSCPPFTMDDYADDIIAELDHHHIERAVIAGLSMGGYTAFACWRRHPERIRALILAATRATPDTPEPAARRRALAERIRQEGMPAIAPSQAAGQLGATTRATRPELVDQVTAMMASVPPATALGAIEAMLARIDSTPTLATITVPTLVLGGDEDPFITSDEITGMARAINGSRLEILTRSGHLCNLERPAAFNHVVAEFLSTVGSTP
jgi:3-oxoadipate enol-lactonase